MTSCTKNRLFFLVVVLVSIHLACCDDDDDYEKFDVSSMSFEDGATIPRRHTCDGENISPPLAFDDLPGGTKGLAVVMEDLDSPVTTFVHWVIWGIPARLGILNENQDQTLQGGAVQGINSAEEIGYFGPCPPEDEEHAYVFKVYALDESILDLAEGSTKQELEKRIEDSILGKAELECVYRR